MSNNKYNFFNENKGEINIANDNAQIINQKLSRDKNCINIDMEKLFDDLIVLKRELNKKKFLNSEEKNILNSVTAAISGANEENEGKVKKALTNSSKYIANCAVSFGLSYLSGILPRL